MDRNTGETEIAKTLADIGDALNKELNGCEIYIRHEDKILTCLVEEAWRKLYVLIFSPFFTLQQC